VAFDAPALSRSLTGRMGIRAFDEEVRERRAARFAAAIDPERLGELFSLARLESLLASDAIPIGYVDLYDDGQLRKLADVQRKSGRSGLAVAADSFRRGSTVRVRDVDAFDPRLNRFAGEVRRLFAARAQVNVYLTPPARDGFPPHFDITDVFVVQCLGRKEWSLFADYTDRRDLPLADTDWDPGRFRPTTAPETMTLHPGDVLYLPRGTMHQASCIDRESMHLTISIEPLTYAELLARVLAQVAARNIELRRRVPWSVDGAGDPPDDVAARVRACLATAADGMDVAALLAAERQALGATPVGGESPFQSAIAGLLEGRPGPA
jgi:hypothetical protein